VETEYELVILPRESPNDDYAVLVSWCKSEGESVSEGEVICELEFSKATLEVTAPRSGYVFHLREEGDQVPVGNPIAAIASTPQRPDLRAAVSAERAPIKVTVKARKLIEQTGIDVTVFEGRQIVREKDVLAHVEEIKWKCDESAADGDLQPLTAARQRAAQTLSESSRMIPHSYLTRWLDAERVEGQVEEVARRRDLMLTLTDWLLANVANAARAFPNVNASWRKDGVFRYAHAHVGFALNRSTGDLIVPVVQDADRLDLEDLVGKLRGLQKRAVRRKLSTQELSGGTITVTSLIGTGVHQVLPIVVPGQAVIVAIGDRCDAFRRAVYALTAAFDHRVLNGMEMAEFLAAVAQRMYQGRSNGSQPEH
jgi:pyruvate/2-oxoglutarate dehydrogenase complex dihydrolipoamide acyltransferase (E2) component